MPSFTPLARKLRQNSTEAEKYLWSRLKRKQFLGLKFRRQQVIENYIVDFLCFEKRIIIELDGGQHADNPKDLDRTSVLESKGFLVIRYWNNDVSNNMEGVLEEMTAIIHPHLNPPPEGEEIMD